jgi:hypothetical protein
MSHDLPDSHVPLFTYWNVVKSRDMGIRQIMGHGNLLKSWEMGIR